MPRSPPGVDMSEWMNDRRPRISRTWSSSSSSAASNGQPGAQALGVAAQPTVTLDSEDEIGPEDDPDPADDSAPEESPVPPENSGPGDDSVSEEHSVSENESAAGDESSSAEDSPSVGGGRRRTSRRNYDDEAYSPSDSSSPGTCSSLSRLDSRDTGTDHKIAQGSSDASSTSADRQDSNTPAPLNSLALTKAFEIFAENSYDQIAEDFNLEPDSISTYVSRTVRSISKRDKRPRREVKDDLNRQRKRNGIIEKIDDQVGIREYKKRGRQPRRHGPRTNRDDVGDTASESSKEEDDEQEAPSEQDPSPELESPPGQESSSEGGGLSPLGAQDLSMGGSPESSQADIEPGVTSASISPRALEDRDQATETPPQEPNTLVEAM